MSPYSRRTGKRYAAGSQSTWAGWEPRDCLVCGRRITLAGPASLHSRAGVDGQSVSVHAACGGLSVLRPVSEAA